MKVDDKNRDMYQKWCAESNAECGLLLTKHRIDDAGLISCHFGTGWVKIVDEAFEKMIAAGWNRKLVQIKEKFCGLRIYIDNTSDAIDLVINDAEDKCAKTCERCGEEHGLDTPMIGIALCTRCEEEMGG